MVSRMPRPSRPLRSTPTAKPHTSPARDNLGCTVGNFPAFIVDDGQPLSDTHWDSLAQVREFVNDSPTHGQRMGMVFIDHPNEELITALGQELNLADFLVEDLIKGNQRPKLERHEDALFVVLSRPMYDDVEETVEYTELHVVTLGNLFIVIRHLTTGNTTWSFSKLIPDESLLCEGPEAVFYHILDYVVDSAIPVVNGIRVDIDEIELQVFSGDDAAPERIYRLSREVIDLQRAVTPIIEIIDEFEDGFTTHQVNEPLRALLEDVDDHVTKLVDHITDFRELLTQILSVNATLVDQRQNEDMKLVSSWGAILLVPTLIGSVYGMNFDNMPELHWEHGYLVALAAMFLSALILYIIFKRKDWL